jgi:hypothetical protein
MFLAFCRVLSLNEYYYYYHLIKQLQELSHTWKMKPVLNIALFAIRIIYRVGPRDCSSYSFRDALINYCKKTCLSLNMRFVGNHLWKAAHFIAFLPETRYLDCVNVSPRHVIDHMTIACASERCLLKTQSIEQSRQSLQITCHPKSQAITSTR